MNRRDMVRALLALGAAPFTVRAQSSKAPRRIGWLSTTSPERNSSTDEAFAAKLKELGYIEGRDFVFERRYAHGHLGELSTLARELIALNPAVIVTASSASVAALKSETKTVPIVFATAADPVEQGFVASLARPGGNITGVTLRSEINGKLVEFIRETLPSVRRIAVLEHESDPVAKRASASYQRAAATLRFQLSIVRVKRVEELKRAFADIARGNAEVLVVPEQSLFDSNGKRIAELAMKARLPSFSTRRFTEDGGMLSYYSDRRENYRRAAVLVDKILKGAKPADLPVEEPDRYALVINMRVAKALGITIPQSILARADEVIQ